MNIDPNRKFSHSSLACYRRCRVKYKWLYIDNIQTPSGVGQLRGTIGHESLGLWYTLMESVKKGEITEEQRDDQVMKQAGEKFAYAEIERGQSLDKEWELMQVILPRYFTWARAMDNFDEIISIEQEFQIDIEGIPVIGYIDGIVRIKNSLWLLEHKFNKRVSTSHLDLDPQISMYLLACYKLGVNVSGVIYNVIRITEGGIAETQPVERKRVFRNQEGLAAKEYELGIQLKELQAIHSTGEGIFYRSETPDCSWDCPFFEACLLMNDSGDPSPVLRKFPIKEKKLEGEKE